MAGVVDSMNFIHRVVFGLLLIAFSWFVMMAFHEFGHVIGAWLTSGVVQKVVLHPLEISRTDVYPNPNPGVVVWLGPSLGVVLPTLIWLTIPRVWVDCKAAAKFVAGFCFIANGAYLGIGSWEGIGDAGEILKSGSPFWTLLIFGLFSIVSGLTLWHRMGSVKLFLFDDEPYPCQSTLIVAVLLTAVVLAGFFVSPR